MNEEDLIRRTESPATVSSLSRDFDSLGLRQATTLLVHSSLSKIGWVAGREHAVVLALQRAVGDEATVVMPSYSGSLSDPESWSNPPVPFSWFEPIRDEMPAYDPDMTPTRGMGAIVNCFRSQRDALRSIHPSESFCARGPLAAQILEDHSLDMCFGEKSPLARLYDLDADILLLGVGHESNSSFHLAEYRANWPGKKTVVGAAPIIVDGERRWQQYQDVDLNSDDFPTLGANFERDTSSVTIGRVGLAECRLMSQRTAVDYAVAWMESNRT